jgi:hypothetical protein
MVLSGVAEEDAVLVSLTDHSIECWGVQHCRMVRRHRVRSVGFSQALGFWARGLTTNEAERARAAEDVFFLPRASHP